LWLATTLFIVLGAGVANAAPPYKYVDLGWGFVPWSIGNNGLVAGCETFYCHDQKVIVWQEGVHAQIGVGWVNEVADDGTVLWFDWGVVPSSMRSWRGTFEGLPLGTCLPPSGNSTTTQPPCMSRDPLEAWRDIETATVDVPPPTVWINSPTYFLNASGQIAGTVDETRSVIRSGGQIVDLRYPTSPPADHRQIRVNGISDAGIVMGGEIASTGINLLAWSSDGEILLRQPGYGIDINDRGQALSTWETVGVVDVSTGNVTPIEYELSPPPARPSLDLVEWGHGAQSINDADQVVGGIGAAYYYSDDPHDEMHGAYYWDAETGMVDLGELAPEAPFRSMRLVPVSPDDSLYEDYPDLESVAGSFQYANDLDYRWTEVFVTDINDAGQIVGFFYPYPVVGRGEIPMHGFLLTPVPEPSTLALAIFAASIVLLKRSYRASRSAGNHRCP
jgi:hypothetical protein